MTRTAPDLDNRAPSLCDYVAAAVEEDVMAQLRALKGDDSQVVTADPLQLVIEGTPRQRSWARTWTLSDHTGTLVKISVRVEEARDHEVIVVVGRETIAVLVPPWVERRGVSDAERHGFHDTVVQKLAAGRDHYLEVNRATLAGRVREPTNP